MRRFGPAPIGGIMLANMLTQQIAECEFDVGPY